MKLILGKINDEYLLSITRQAVGETEYVEAAVAYASTTALLFDWCWENKILLRYWGRFDETLPVTVPVLKTFLDRRSANYNCKLVRHFHPKVIWWHGYGAYIGSANLSDAAWTNNIEAGVFLTDAELEESTHARQLEDFFQTIDEHASPLTEELFRTVEQRARTLQAIRAKDRAEVAAFSATPHVHAWAGLVTISSSSTAQTRKAKFLKEWNETLQKLRDLAVRVSQDENRPVWIRNDTSRGAQADQFLHAHYYERTFEGVYAKFEEHFQRHRANPDLAVRDALEWWGQLKEPPGTEKQMLEEWVPFLRERLSKERVLAWTEQDLIEVCSRVYAIRDHGRRVANAALELVPDRSYTIEEKAQALARHLWRSRSANGGTIAELVHWVLYDGPKTEIPERIWEAISAPRRRIDHFGISALGELVGWALPDDFPPRNGRTSKALRSLGYDVTVHSSS